MLALVVIGGAAFAITGVWFFGRSKVVATHSKEIAELETTIADLKERLENVEVINRYEASLAAEEGNGVEGGRTMGVQADS